MWRLRRVSDDKFLLQGSHRKSSVRPGAAIPPEAARDGDVHQGFELSDCVRVCACMGGDFWRREKKANDR
jgi:hypothetical protein